MKYLVLWLIYNTVITDCPDLKPNSDRQCAALHLETYVKVKSKFFGTRDSAAIFYDSLLTKAILDSAKQFTVFFNNDVKEVKIDSFNIE